jgi:3',5'-cyclic AMP phosphodiesterase CpdA
VFEPLIASKAARGRAKVALPFSLLAALVVAATALGIHSDPNTAGHTTLQQVLAGVDADGNPDTDYQTLTVQQVSEGYLLRDRASEGSDNIPFAQSGREARRASLAYFGQMTDFQLLDEESPARVEFLDAPFGQDGPSSAWRPAEAFVPFEIEASVRQLNRFAAASPVPEGDGDANAMDFVLITGDQADNNQRNETVWVRELLEGGSEINFNSGLTDPAAYPAQLPPDPNCATLLALEGGPAGAAAEAAGYTGVQDYDDYPPPSTGNEQFYDPDDVRGQWAAEGWPTYPGLMDRAQQITITPVGLDVPFYITNGNHDSLVQGNEDANQAFERIALSCTKVLGSTLDPENADSFEDLLTAPSQVMPVPPDPQRQFLSKLQIKQIYAEKVPNDDDHGFAYVDPAEKEDSRDSASYYAWDPQQAPGFRFISLDTVSEGGVLGPFGPQPTGSSDGNLDDPQFEWLKRELDAAQAAGKLIVLFAHHPIRSMNSTIPDEAAAPCTAPDEHGHDLNPGCDLDPRDSNPVHLGDPVAAEELGSNAQTLLELLAKYPNVISYVPGHTHENRVIPYPKENGDVFWEINTTAVIDHPQQSRLIEVFDNRDGTLSIFGTILDHASPAEAPAIGTDVTGFGPLELASIGRHFAWNDPQTGHLATETGGAAGPSGRPEDRNVELLLGDPRISRGKGKGLRCGGRRATIVGTSGDDRIKGTQRSDVIVTGEGRDRVSGRRGKDVICTGDERDQVRGGAGRDFLRGGKARDRLNGQRAGDRVGGGKGPDRLRGGKGRDRLNGGPGGDRMRGGKGRDNCGREARGKAGNEQKVRRGPDDC